MTLKDRLKKKKPQTALQKMRERLSRPKPSSGKLVLEAVEKLEKKNLGDIQSLLKEMTSSVIKEKFKEMEEDIAQEVEDRVNERTEEYIKNNIKGETGDKGEQGEVGDKGESIVGPQGAKGEDGIGKDGENGRDGVDGLDGKDGKDADEKAVENRLLKKIPKEIEPQKIKSKLIELPIKERWFDARHIKNLPEPSFGGAIHRGGGSGLSILAATGTIDDSNVTFTFTAIPSAVVVNGAVYNNGNGVTISGTTATLDNPIGTGGSIIGLK